MKPTGRGRCAGASSPTELVFSSLPRSFAKTSGLPKLVFGAGDVSASRRGGKAPYSCICPGICDL